MLDFAKVKPGEREAADRAFAEAEGGAAAAAARTFEPGDAVGAAGPSSSGAGAAGAAAGGAKAPPSEAKLAALRAALEGAATLEEVAEIEAQLAQGGANGGPGDTEGQKDMDQG